MKAFLEERIASLQAVCAGKNWRAYAVLLAVIAWFTLAPTFDGDAWSPVTWINVAIHESGHFVTFRWAPAWISVPAGTLFQLAAPLLCGWLLARQREPFALPVALVWFGLSLRQCGPYIADATEQQGPLLQVGAYTPTIHDWHYMLDGLDLLSLDGFLGTCAVVLGATTTLGGMVAGIWCLRWMATQPKRKASAQAGRLSGSGRSSPPRGGPETGAQVTSSQPMRTVRDGRDPQRRDRDRR